MIPMSNSVPAPDVLDVQPLLFPPELLLGIQVLDLHDVGSIALREVDLVAMPNIKELYGATRASPALLPLRSVQCMFCALCWR